MPKNLKYTIFGSTGFIGGELVRYLRGIGHDVFEPAREYRPQANQDLGHVIYCIGLTADFRKYPLQTVEAHVTRLSELLQKSTYQSWVYLSSTRVYQRVKASLATETNTLPVQPEDHGDLYNLSKLMGESVCHSFKSPRIKVARLSNVVGGHIGDENFLSAVLRQIVKEKKVTLESSVNSEKDFIHVQDVVELLPRLYQGKVSTYNIASGKNLSTLRILDELKKHVMFKVEKKGKTLHRFPRISTQRIKKEFGYQPRNVLELLPTILRSSS